MLACGGRAVSYERARYLCAGIPRSLGAAPKCMCAYETVSLQGCLAHKKPQPPQDHHMILLYGPRGGLFLMSEVPLYLARDVLCPGVVCLSSLWLLQAAYRGTSPIRKRLPTQNPPRTLGIGLR